MDSTISQVNVNVWSWRRSLVENVIRSHNINILSITETPKTFSFQDSRYFVTTSRGAASCWRRIRFQLPHRFYRAQLSSAIFRSSMLHIPSDQPLPGDFLEFVVGFYKRTVILGDFNAFYTRILTWKSATSPIFFKTTLIQDLQHPIIWSLTSLHVSSRIPCLQTLL